MALFSNTFFRTFASNVHSQNGEDGVIKELLRRLNIPRGGVAVEFGAWDGVHLSNTFRLVEECDFKVVYIEGDEEKFRDLLVTAQKFPRNISPVHAYVDWHPSSPSSLDSLLRSATLPNVEPVPPDFDVLSIDIDSFDYQVWKSLEGYRPKIVIIEINSGAYPFDEKHVHGDVIKTSPEGEPCETPFGEHCSARYQGTGFAATYKLAREKGYTFVCHTGNAIFVRDDLYGQLGLPAGEHPMTNFRLGWLSPADYVRLDIDLRSCRKFFTS